MHIQKNETLALEALVILALSRGDLVLMKRGNTIRNHGKTPELCLAECMAAAYHDSTTEDTSA